jgi:hypothetical protein
MRICIFENRASFYNNYKNECQKKGMGSSFIPLESCGFEQAGNQLAWSLAGQNTPYRSVQFLGRGSAISFPDDLKYQKEEPTHYGKEIEQNP